MPDVAFADTNAVAAARNIVEALACGESGCSCRSGRNLGSGLVHCPAHDDRRASLSVGIKGEKVVLKCFGGCTQEAVISALRERGLWPTGKGSGNGRRIVATYAYHDADRHLLYQEVRYQPKDFRLRHPDGNGGWTWNLDEVDRVPYRLPELLGADPSEIVFVVEGGKDADRLASLGQVATTNVGGAGKWRDSYSEPLRGRHVVILPDNDDAGHHHADQVAASLVGVAASVKILELPGLAENGDVSDWLDADHTADELLELSSNTTMVGTGTAVSHIGRDEVLEVVNRWLCIADMEAIDVIMATALAIYLPGDPLWLQVVAPPGGTKTELLRALQGPKVVSISTMTPQTLISGLKGKTEELLPKLDGKLLVVKDFTSILSKKAEDSTAIFADLREAYDGYLEKSFGSGVGIKAYHARFGFIAGVTPAIDMYRTVHALLGERFLRVNVVGDEQGAISRASELEGSEKAMREEIGRGVGGFLTMAGEWTDPDMMVEKRLLEHLQALARITAVLRSPVARDRQHHVLYPPQREIGTRLVKQLQKMAKALANWRERVLVTAEDYATVRRVALDGVPSGRLAVLSALLTEDGWLTTKQVGQVANLPTETAGEHLEDLWMLGLLLRQGDSAFSWAAADGTRELLDKAAIDLGTQTTLGRREDRRPCSEA